MQINRFAVLAAIVLALIMGCSGDYARIKNQSRADSKATQNQLIDNWSDYNIWFRATVIVFDPKEDDKKILVGRNWGTVNDQETWTAIVEANTTSHGNIDPVWSIGSMTGVREVRGHDNQFYGYIIHQQRDLVSARFVDKNTVRIYHTYAPYGGP